MAEEKQPVILALGRGFNGFYCPKTRFHLVGIVKPQAVWPEGVALTDDVKRALRGGTLVDVNQTLSAEDISFKVTAETPMTSSDRKKQQLLDSEENQKLASEEGTLKEDGSTPEEQSDLLSETDIDQADKKTLTAFIKKNDLQIEGVNSRTGVDDLKTALKVHFGYAEAEAAE